MGDWMYTLVAAYGAATLVTAAELWLIFDGGHSRTSLQAMFLVVGLLWLPMRLAVMAWNASDDVWQDVIFLLCACACDRGGGSVCACVRV